MDVPADDISTQLMVRLASSGPEQTTGSRRIQDGLVRFDSVGGRERILPTDNQLNQVQTMRASPLLYDAP